MIRYTPTRKCLNHLIIGTFELGNLVSWNDSSLDSGFNLTINVSSSADSRIRII